MSTGSRKGSLIVDAACSIPIFIIAIVLLLHLIVQCGAEEVIGDRLVTSAHTAIRSAARCNEEAEGLSDILKLSFLTAYAAKSDARSPAKHTQASIPVVLCGKDTILRESRTRIDSIVCAETTVTHTLPAGRFTVRNPTFRQRAVFRPFVGESEQLSRDDRFTVYVFPHRGTRYHCRTCSILKEGEIEVVLNARVRAEYTPCLICLPDALPDGAPVGMFSSGSRTYHRSDCSIVQKSYVCMTRAQAKDAGYTPCQLCRGGH